MGDYKLIVNAANYEYTPKAVDNFVLFNLEDDPKEEINLYSSKKKVAKDLKQELEKWWTSIVQSPHSFTMPVFNIGYDSATSIFIHAKGALDMSKDIIPTSHQLTDIHQGDYVLFSLEVIIPGKYKITPVYNKNTGLYVDWIINSKDISVKTNMVAPGIIKLEEGEQTIKFTLDSSQQDFRFELRGFYFDKV